MNCVDESRNVFVKERGITRRRGEREEETTIKKSVRGKRDGGGREKSGSEVGGSGRGGSGGARERRKCFLANADFLRYRKGKDSYRDGLRNFQEFWSLFE
jgi:hypothetical protein